MTQPTKTDRVLSVLFGPKNTSELFMTLVGLVLLVTGYTQTCPAYSLLGIRTLRGGN
mgnify:CR=1 FL=1